MWRPCKPSPAERCQPPSRPSTAPRPHLQSRHQPRTSPADDTTAAYPRRTRPSHRASRTQRTIMAAPDPEHRADGPRDEGLQAEFPDEAGVDVPPVPIEKVETERLLENEVR